MSVILVAEMEAKTRRMLRRFLEGCKLEVQAAANLQEAQGLLAAARIDALVVGLGACALGELRTGGAPMEAAVDVDVEVDHCGSARSAASAYQHPGGKKAGLCRRRGQLASPPGGPGGNSPGPVGLAPPPGAGAALPPGAPRRHLAGKGYPAAAAGRGGAGPLPAGIRPAGPAAGPSPAHLHPAGAAGPPLGAGERGWTTGGGCGGPPSAVTLRKGLGLCHPNGAGPGLPGGADGGDGEEYAVKRDGSLGKKRAGSPWMRWSGAWGLPMSRLHISDEAQKDLTEIKRYIFLDAFASESGNPSN